MPFEPAKNDNLRWDVPLWVFLGVLVLGALSYFLQVP